MKHLNYPVLFSDLIHSGNNCGAGLSYLYKQANFVICVRFVVQKMGIRCVRVVYLNVLNRMKT